MRPIDADALYERAYQLNLDYIVSDVELRMLKTLLDHAPTIEGRKKGRWIKRGKIFQCPECEKFSITQDNYCSNCGADMREEKNDE